MHEPTDWSWRDQILRNMWKHNDPIYVIAKVLKVSSNTIRKRCAVLELKARRKPQKQAPKANAWTNNEVRILERMWLEGRPVAAIMDALPGRSVEAIWTMRQKLELKARYSRVDKKLGLSVSQELYDRIGREANRSREFKSRFLAKLVEEALDRREQERAETVARPMLVLAKCA